MGPKWSVVSGLSTAATIQTAAIAVVQPITERSESVGVVIVVMQVERRCRRLANGSVMNETIGGAEESWGRFLVEKRRETR